MYGSVWTCDGVRLRFMLFLIFDLCCSIFIYRFMVFYVIIGVELFIVEL